MESAALTSFSNTSAVLSKFVAEAKKGEPYDYLCSPGKYFPNKEHVESGQVPKATYDIFMCIHYLRDLKNEMPMFVVDEISNKIEIPAYCCFTEFGINHKNATLEDFLRSKTYMTRLEKSWQCNKMENGIVPHFADLKLSFVKKMLDKEDMKMRTMSYNLSSLQQDVAYRNNYLKHFGFSDEEIAIFKDNKVPPPITRSIKVNGIEEKNFINPQWMTFFHKCAYYPSSGKKNTQLKEGFCTRLMVGQKQTNMGMISVMCNCVVESNKVSERGFYTTFKVHDTEFGTGINMPEQYHSYLNYYFDFSTNETSKDSKQQYQSKITYNGLL
jgi:hypothetical protein